MNYKQLKTFGLYFLVSFTIMQTSIFAYHINLDIENIQTIVKILFFDKFFLEYIIASIVFILFMNKYKVFQIIAFVVFVVYIGINMSQLITYLISGEFLSRLALDNLEFAGFLVTYENIIIILEVIGMLLVIPSIVSYFFTKKFIILSYYAWIVFLVLLMIILLSYDKFTNLTKDREALYSENYFQDSPPITSLIEIFKQEKQDKLHFDTKEVRTLKKLGIKLNPFSEYPLMKNTVYEDSPKFDTLLETPNIILIFTEGLSARMTNVYSERYPDITPNLKMFSEDISTMRVDNFYNHTAATYRGLHGQLCSLYPYMGGGKYWFKNDVLDLTNITYRCLPHILKEEGYETIYLNMHYKNESANDDMVSYFGFDSILSGEVLSDRYLSGVNKIKPLYLSDHQSYSVLTNYLKEKEREVSFKKPFFLATYTIETHAFLDIGSDGVPYKDGENNVLNTVKNMDDAFGKFWEYFKKSQFSKNTIIIFTSDHAHYNGKEYRHTLKKYGDKNYHPLFVDKVPLLIYAPSIVNIESHFDAKQATSIDLAPSILNLLNLNNIDNAFIGKSIFTKDKMDVGISAFGRHLFYIKKDYRIHIERNVLETDRYKFKTIRKFIKYTHGLEKNNKIYKAKDNR